MTNKGARKIRDKSSNGELSTVGETPPGLTNPLLAIRKSQKKANMILISVGVNDVTGLSSTRYWRFQVNALVAELKRKWPKAQIVFIERAHQ